MRYVIVNTIAGDVVSTNDEDLVKETAACEDYYVIDVTTCEWLQLNGTRKPIPEAT